MPISLYLHAVTVYFKRFSVQPYGDRSYSSTLRTHLANHEDQCGVRCFEHSISRSSAVAAARIGIMRSLRFDVIWSSCHLEGPTHIVFSVFGPIL